MTIDHNTVLFFDASSLIAVAGRPSGGIPPLAKFEIRKSQINEKDLHVVVAASAINTSYLLTLDRGLEIEVNQANLNFLAFSPGEFIKTVLPEHVDFPPGKS